MKKTKISWLFFILQMFFVVALPCIFIWLQFGGIVATGYKISITTLLLLLLIFLTFKKIFLSKWLKAIDQKLVNIETNALSITDETGIAQNKRAWRNYSLVQLFFSSIIPILLFIVAILTIKNVEKGIIELYGCLMFCVISIATGLAFKVLEIYSVKLANEK